MKKFFMFAAMASVALVSCVKNEPAMPVAQQDEISFESPLMAVPVRAVAEKTAFAQADKFTVWGYFSATAYDDNLGDIYMNDVDCVKNGDRTNWHAESGKYYWPANGYLNFVACAPNDAAFAVQTNTPSVSATAGVISIVNYEVPATANEDLLVSERSYNCTKTLADANTTANPWNNGATLTFKHVLSSIVFKVKSAEDYAGASPIATVLQVTGVKINGVNYKGNFNQIYDTEDLPQMDFTKDMWTEVPADVTNYTAFTSTTAASAALNGVYTDVQANTEGSAIPLSTTAKWVMNNGADRVNNKTDLIVLPQAIPANAEVEVTYTIWNTTMGESTLPHAAQTAKAKLWKTVDEVTTGITKWEAGKRYIYTITVSLDEITLDPEVAAWDAGTEVVPGENATPVYN